jgi:trimeric autotransporter adhesin
LFIVSALWLGVGRWVIFAEGVNACISMLCISVCAMHLKILQTPYNRKVTGFGAVFVANRGSSSKLFMTYLKRICTVFILSNLLFSQTNAQITVTVTNSTNVTPSLNPSYPSLQSAITALNAITSISGSITLTAGAGTEMAPIGGYQINFTASTSATSAVQITGAGTSTLVASNTLNTGALNDALIKIVGSDYVTISNFSLQENAANTITDAATNNMTEWGVALLYASPTDGAQHCTIQNNTMSLKRNYPNTFGIYANATHTASSPTTSATATTLAGSNSGLKIYGNVIQNVNHGILVVGPTAAASFNQSIDIGGTSSATANAISDFGSTSSFSAFANVSASVFGILVRNSTSINISQNSITSSVGGTTSGVLRGIYLPAFSVLPTGTFATNILQNSLALTTGAASSNMQGIAVEATTSTASSELNMSQNNFSVFTSSVPTTASFTLLFDAMPHFLTRINDNAFQNLTVSTNGTLTLIQHSYSMPAGGSTLIQNNNVVTGLTKSGTSGSLIFSNTVANSPSTSSITYSGNDFSNIGVSGTSSISGILNLDGLSTAASVKTITGNAFRNWSGGTGARMGISVSHFHSGSHLINQNIITNLSGQTAVTGIALNASANSATAILVQDNQINQLNSTGTGGNVLGFVCSNTSPGIVIQKNTVFGLSTTGSNTVYGISFIGGNLNPVSVAKNKIYDLSGSNTGSIVSGINITGGTSYTISNNLIGDLRATASTGLNAINGINASANAVFQIYYNSICLNATSSSVTTFGNSCITFSSSATDFNAINNVLVNTSTPAQNNMNTASNGVVCLIRRSNGTINQMPSNYSLNSNSNAFWVNHSAGMNNHLIYCEGISTLTNLKTTITEVKAFLVNREQLSSQENIIFLSTTGSDAQFLKFSPIYSTQLESTAMPISGFTDDFSGAARHGNASYTGSGTAPDVGAWELDGISATIHITAYIQGFMNGASTMKPVLMNSGVVGATADQCDTVIVELHKAYAPYALEHTFQGVLKTDGSLNSIFPGILAGTQYYIVLKGRNFLETWSASTLPLAGYNAYPFNTSAAQAYGSNLINMGGVFAIHSGNIYFPVDASIDLLDYPVWETDYNNFAIGYFRSDLNGDGIVDLVDYPIWELNYNNFVQVMKP